MSGTEEITPIFTAKLSRLPHYEETIGAYETREAARDAILTRRTYIAPANIALLSYEEDGDDAADMAISVRYGAHVELEIYSIERAA